MRKCIKRRKGGGGRMEDGGWRREERGGRREDGGGRRSWKGIPLLDMEDSEDRGGLRTDQTIPGATHKGVIWCTLSQMS
jgi:hypothetical protein